MQSPCYVHRLRWGKRVLLGIRRVVAFRFRGEKSMDEVPGRTYWVEFKCKIQ